MRIVAREEDVAGDRAVEPQEMGSGGVLERRDDARAGGTSPDVHRRRALGEGH